MDINNLIPNFDQNLEVITIYCKIVRKKATVHFARPTNELQTTKKKLEVN